MIEQLLVERQDRWIERIRDETLEGDVAAQKAAREAMERREVGQQTLHDPFMQRVGADENAVEVDRQRDRVGVPLWRRCVRQRIRSRDHAGCLRGEAQRSALSPHKWISHRYANIATPGDAQGRLES